MKVAYVCTNFNNAKYTKSAIESLLKNMGHEIYIVIVDNASDADDIHFVEGVVRSHEHISLILNKHNVGYFSGLNIGIKYLRDLRPEIEWFIVGNNDLIFPDDFLDRLERIQFRLIEYPVVSPDIVTTSGHHQNPHVIKSISKFRELFYNLYYSNYYLGCMISGVSKILPWLTARGDERHWSTPGLISQGHGSCYLLGPRFFDSFTELWSPTFMMHEEYFLSKQLNDVGMAVYYDPAIMVKHDCHGSLKNISSRARWNLARLAHKEYRKFVSIFHG